MDVVQLVLVNCIISGYRFTITQFPYTASDNMYNTGILGKFIK